MIEIKRAIRIHAPPLQFPQVRRLRRQAQPAIPRVEIFRILREGGIWHTMHVNGNGLHLTALVHHAVLYEPSRIGLPHLS
jgi:hypothetical protein